MTKPKDSSTAKNMTHHAGTWKGNDIEECLADVVESRGKITLPEPKDMTDAELVEAVAREVMGCIVTGDWGTSGKIVCKTPPIGIQFDPFHDMNDLQMVKDKFFVYKESKNGEWVEVTLYSMDVGSKKLATVLRPNVVRAWLEAALEAERGKKR